MIPGKEGGGSDRQVCNEVDGGNGLHTPFLLISLVPAEGYSD